MPGCRKEELAEAASLSARSISDLERGINATARRQTARLLADALGLTGVQRADFEATALGRSPGSKAGLTVMPVDSVALRDRHCPGERSQTRRYLKPIFGCLRRNRRGGFAAAVTRYLKRVYAAEPANIDDFPRQHTPGA